MRSLFHPDSPVMQALTELFNMILLNLLTMLCCIPVVTAGASLSAMYYVCIKEQRQEGGGVTRMFFRSFRRNLKQGAAASLLLLAFAALMFMDLNVAKAYEGQPASRVFRLLVWMLIFAASFFLQMLFPMIARFTGSLTAQLKRSVLFAAKHMPRVLAMLALWAADVVLLYLADVRWAPLFVMLGLSLPGYLCTLLYDPVLRKIEKDMQPAEIGLSENEKEL